MRSLIVNMVAVVGLAAVPVTATAIPTTAVAQPTGPAAVMPAKVVYKFKNCTAMNKVYPHGVGKTTAHDHTSGDPVTDFKKSTTLYKKIVGYPKGLDRDHDGIACERA